MSLISEVTSFFFWHFPYIHVCFSVSYMHCIYPISHRFDSITAQYLCEEQDVLSYSVIFCTIHFHISSSEDKKETEN